MTLRKRPAGSLIPDIALYNEETRNSEVIADIFNHDLGQNPDILIVMGTSLRIECLKKMVRVMANGVRERGGMSLLVNRDELSGWRDIFDYHVRDELDHWVQITLGYWEYTIPEDWAEGRPLNPSYMKRFDLIKDPEVQWNRSM